MNDNQKIGSSEPSKMRIIAEHASGFIGMVFSAGWIIVLLIISFIEPFKQDFFLDNWYNAGLFLAILPSVADLIGHAWKLILGKVQMIYAIQAAREAITGVSLLLLGVLFPFDFGEANPLAKVLLFVIPILSLLSSVTSLYKYLTWDQRDKKSLL